MEWFKVPPTTSGDSVEFSSLHQSWLELDMRPHLLIDMQLSYIQLDLVITASDSVRAQLESIMVVISG